jgi:hypothetical protein
LGYAGWEAGQLDQELADNFGNDFGNVPLNVIINGEGKVTQGSYIYSNN